MENMDFESMQAALAQSWEVHRQGYSDTSALLFDGKQKKFNEKH